jgi:hypothetical protein
MTAPPTLFELLPAIHRVRDAASGHVLEALLEVLDGERRRLEADIDQLYDNWFIETADEWVVPYIGDLLAVRGIRPIEAEVITQRGVVANTIRYRRRKGTAAVLEELARDVSGWPARVVEFFETLATTQFMNHVRPHNVVTADLRRGEALGFIGTPFDTAAHTADVRHVDNRRGRHNIPNIGLFLWRLQAYRVVRGAARPVAAATASEAGRYHVNPLGLDAPLFNLARTQDEVTHLALSTDVPGPIGRRPLAAELRARQTDQLDELQGRDRYFGSPPVVEVYLDGADLPVPVDRLAICDLSDPPSGLAEGWRRPPASVEIAIDPVIGRLALPAGVTATSVEVSYAYGFSGDLGGGPYNRQPSVARSLVPDQVTWQRGVSARATPGQLPEIVPDLATAIAAWNAAPASFGVIAMMDSRSYGQPLPTITIPAGSKLVLLAADWPEDPDNPGSRRLGRIIPRQVRPHIAGSLEVTGTAPDDAPDAGSLVINGLLVEGSLTVATGNLGRLTIAHTTLVPTAGVDSLVVTAGSLPGQSNSSLTVWLDRTISGRLNVAALSQLDVRDSIIDGGPASASGPPAISAGDTRIEGSTIRGTTALRALHASNTIFTEPVQVERRQVGCVRYSYVPPGSLVPRRFRCQPADPGDVGRMVPQFTSLEFGQPGYGQLASGGPSEIASMGEDEGEMGAFRFLAQPDRLTNIRTSLEEYLRLGLEAGVFLVT